MKDITKTVKSSEDTWLIIKRFIKTIENELKEQRGGFFSLLIGTLGASLWGNSLFGKGE